MPAVEYAIMKNNSERFNLTKTTPMMSPYMTKKSGYLAEKQLGMGILQEKYTQDPNVADHANKFLEFITKSPPLRQSSSDVDRTDYINYWISARKHTSSSISGRHFGHFKAASRS